MYEAFSNSGSGDNVFIGVKILKKLFRDLKRMMVNPLGDLGK